MERHFEQELDKLNRRILKMGGLVSEQVKKAMTALVRCDVQLAEEIIEGDIRLDKLDVKIDKLCQRIFVLTQPVATDLRLIMSALKMNNDLERMGDLAVSIARKIEGIHGSAEIIAGGQIDELAKMTGMIVNDVINVLHSRNIAVVNDIFADARIIKDKTRILSEKIIDRMKQEPELIPGATCLIIILTHIGRLADYTTNIAESVIFLVDGRIVKHGILREED